MPNLGPEVKSLARLLPQDYSKISQRLLILTLEYSSANVDAAAFESSITSTIHLSLLVSCGSLICCLTDASTLNLDKEAETSRDKSFKIR